ncbi:MAG: MmcQ/YjbR family DNA-binding protein [Alphaproteobacteria bacterium]|nr:MmcQ/YjbR family DNA-binding protein [Alphaproteobacteria bacterium]
MADLADEALLAHLRAVATAYPEAYEEAPWGDLVAKVRDRIFVFYALRERRVHLTVKLPESREAALQIPGSEPTGYGLGKSGWVSLRMAGPRDPAVLEGWIEESYRAVAPKTLSRRIPEGGVQPAPPTPPAEVGPDAPAAAVVSDDPLRLARCLEGLAARGVRGEPGTTTDLAGLARIPAVAVVVDLGRSPGAALEMAQELALLHFDGALCLAGIRDAKTEKAVREALPGAVVYDRRPPGDPGVLDALLAALSG